MEEVINDFFIDEAETTYSTLQMPVIYFYLFSRELIKSALVFVLILMLEDIISDIWTKQASSEPFVPDMARHYLLWT
jgi:hypothetical protein